MEPSLERIQELSAKPENADKNLIPVYMTINADLDTPVSILIKLRGAKQCNCFLLESIAPGEKIARYSFIGANPLRILTSGTHEEYKGDPLERLEKEMKAYRIVSLPELPIPLTGGAVGYCAFDAIRHFEQKLAPFVEKQKDVLRIPESIYMIFDTVVVFDHVFHSLKIVSHCRLDEGDLSLAYAASHEKIMSCFELISKSSLSRSISIVHQYQGAQDDEIDLEASSNIGKQGYMKIVDELKHHIVDGDIFQAVPSQRLRVDLPDNMSSLDLYRQMRIINPSPYMFYIEMEERFEIVGASPEMLVRVNHERVIETHPIAGTKHRGRTDTEDEELAKELLADEKERAEHIMLVDLGRNDVGRVAKPGSVLVESLMKIEKYSHVMHIVSVVTGVLDDKKNLYDAYRSIFPAGTLSGAPKVKAMELICTMEKERRGLYGGSVGYISFSGYLDTAIAIRTILVKDKNVWCQAGGGVVYDSDPASEYTETVNKLGSAIRTLVRGKQQANCVS